MKMTLLNYVMNEFPEIIAYNNVGYSSSSEETKRRIIVNSYCPHNFLRQNKILTTSKTIADMENSMLCLYNCNDNEDTCFKCWQHEIEVDEKYLNSYLLDSI